MHWLLQRNLRLSGEAGWDFETDRAYIERAMAREIVSQLAGEEAAFEIYVQGDPQVQEGFELLRKAHSRQDLFRLAEAVPSPKEKSTAAPSRAEAADE